MNILLMNPSLRTLIRPPPPPLGILYIAAVLEECDHTVNVFDVHIEPLKKIEKLHPDVVGITSLTVNFHEAVALARKAKENWPDTCVVMGGPHVTFTDVETVKTVPEIDVVVRFEGEETMKELVQRVEQGGDFSSISGITYREKDNIVKTPPREPIKNLDALPFPARHLLNMHKYSSISKGLMITSRGCPYHCIFCSTSKHLGSTYRTRGVDNVLDEVEVLLSKHKTDYIQFADDNFALNRKRVLQICKEIHQRGLNFLWSCLVRVNEVDFSLLKTMKDAGCRRLLYGVESCNQDVLNTCRKAYTVEQARKAVRWANSVGIFIDTSFIVGLPGETPETFQEVIKFIKEEKPFRASILHLAPFPGSEIYKNPEKYGITVLHYDWSRYGLNTPVVETETIPAEVAEELACAANTAFVDNLSDAVFSKNKNIKSWHNPDGTVSILDPTTRRVYTLSQCGSQVWDLLDKEVTIPDIMNHIAQDTRNEMNTPLQLLFFLWKLSRRKAILAENLWSWFYNDDL